MRNKSKKQQIKMIIFCSLFIIIGIMSTINNQKHCVHAATKTYRSKKYYKNKVITNTRQTFTRYGSMTYSQKHKERSITKKVIQTKTVYYKYTKKVTTSTTVKNSKEKFAYSKKKTTLSDVKKYLPNAVYKSFQKEHYSIIQDPTDKAFVNNHTAGIFSVKRKAIILREYRSDQEAILHEMGHFMNLMNNNCSKTSEFETVYKKERYQLGSSYGATNLDEYFAECFKVYCKDKKALQKKCPDTYNFMNATIQKM